MTRQCKNRNCGKSFEAKSIIHAFCSDECRKAVRGSEYRKARELAFIRDGYTCTECGIADTDTPNPLECHHINPLCLGGDNSLSNLQTLCRPCHKAKHRNWRTDEQNGTQWNQKKGTGRSGSSEEYDNAA